MELAAQIVGFCGTAGLFISYQQNTKNRILLFQIIGITMFTLHFFLLSAWSGCMMNPNSSRSDISFRMVAELIPRGNRREIVREPTGSAVSR